MPSVVLLGGASLTVEGRTLVYEATRDGDLVDWDCSGGDLPGRYRPAHCRAD